MNMVFKDGNPYIAPLQLIASLPSIAGSGLFGTMLQAMLSLDAFTDLSVAMANDNERVLKAAA